MRIIHLSILCFMSLGVLSSYFYMFLSIAAKSLQVYSPSFIEPSTKKLLVVLAYGALGGGHLIDISKQCRPNDNTKTTAWEDCISAVLKTVISAALVLGKYQTAISEGDSNHAKREELYVDQIADNLEILTSLGLEISYVSNATELAEKRELDNHEVIVQGYVPVSEDDGVLLSVHPQLYTIALLNGTRSMESLSTIRKRGYHNVQPNYSFLKGGLEILRNSDPVSSVQWVSDWFDNQSENNADRWISHYLGGIKKHPEIGYVGTALGFGYGSTKDHGSKQDGQFGIHGYDNAKDLDDKWTQGFNWCFGVFKSKCATGEEAKMKKAEEIGRQNRNHPIYVDSDYISHDELR